MNNNSNNNYNNNANINIYIQNIRIELCIKTKCHADKKKLRKEKQQKD